MTTDTSSINNQSNTDGSDPIGLQPPPAPPCGESSTHTDPPPSAPPASPVHEPDDPSEGDIPCLLRNPEGFLCRLSGDGASPMLPIWLTAATIGGSALFGLAAGFFAGGGVAALDALKGAGIAVATFLLCAPSLYVFTCVGGTKLPLRKILMLGAACTGTAGCLFAALAPVLWLFAVSSASAAFIVLLSVAIGAVAARFALRPLRAACSSETAKSITGPFIWFVLVIVVAMQMISLSGPMLSKKGLGYRTEKGFFVVKLVESLFADAGVNR